MNSPVAIETVLFFADVHGWAIEPICEQQIPVQLNAPVALTESDSVRDVLIES